MAYWHDHALTLSVSPDGIHWTEVGRTGRAGDRSTFFYNPFRRVWVLRRARRSVRRLDQRAVSPLLGDAPTSRRRATGPADRRWRGCKADSRDHGRPGLAERPELYNLDCVGYESLMLGLFTIWRGESLLARRSTRSRSASAAMAFTGIVPIDRPFLGVSQTPGAWNWANVQSAGGCCLVVGDQLYFYVSGRQGRPGTDEPGVCTTGLATLRRDGFASMDWLPGGVGVIRGRVTGAAAGVLTTRPVRFTGEHLFVNADLQHGELRVEVLDRDGHVDRAVHGRGVRAGHGKRHEDGGAVDRGRARRPHGPRRALPVHDDARAACMRSGSVPRPSGESRGYPAAGGPEFSGPIDVGDRHVAGA